MAICYVDILLAFGLDELLYLKGMCALHEVLSAGQMHSIVGGLVTCNPVGRQGEAKAFRREESHRYGKNYPRRLHTRDIFVDTRCPLKPERGKAQSTHGGIPIGWESDCLGAFLFSTGIEGYRRHMRDLLDKVKACKFYTKMESCWRSSLGE